MLKPNLFFFFSLEIILRQIVNGKKGGGVLRFLGDEWRWPCIRSLHGDGLQVQNYTKPDKK